MEGEKEDLKTSWNPHVAVIATVVSIQCKKLGLQFFNWRLNPKLQFPNKTFVIYLYVEILFTMGQISGKDKL